MDGWTLGLFGGWAVVGLGYVLGALSFSRYLKTRSLPVPDRRAKYERWP